jgi:hypothetical protein
MKNGPAIISALIALLATGLAAQENESATPIGATVTDIDGNVYKTVAIGHQIPQRRSHRHHQSSHAGYQQRKLPEIPVGVCR